MDKMTKSFKDMSIKQIEKLARKNRESSQKEVDKEYEKRGLDKSKRIGYTYVDKSKDGNIKDAHHSEIFNVMKKRPHQD